MTVFSKRKSFISTKAKKFYTEDLIFAGCRYIEMTNLGNLHLMHQFRDEEELLSHLQ